MPPVRFETAIPASERATDLCLRQRDQWDRSRFSIFGHKFTLSC